jgi:CDP-6-deoxy-D-xylo-4-hexulose-3-dehydrase
MAKNCKGKRKMSENERVLRQEIFKMIKKIFKLRADSVSFLPIKDKVQYAGSVYDHEEVENMLNAILDGWLGVGKYVNKFEAELSKFLDVKKALMVNSGSSANLLAITSLLSHQLSEKVRLKPGDEVITPAVTFPTTLNPILQNGLVPVFVDVKIGSYTMDLRDLKLAFSDKVRAVLIPHTLGNPNEMGPIVDFAKEHNLFLIEDACDALGSKYNGKYVGSFGDFGTFSFYPAHQITTGEGGALVTNNDMLYKIALSLRDWGRACVMPVCNPLHCGHTECSKSSKYSKRTIADLPEDYDQRYMYTNIGYNLKPTEIQGAMGSAQLKKLYSFIEARKKNFDRLYDELLIYEDYFFLPEPSPKSEPCWFAFPLTIKEKAPFKRKDMINHFTKHNIEVKLMFSGNILHHPAYNNIKFRVAKSLSTSNYIMHNTFFLGVYPGLTEEKTSFIIETMKKFVSEVCS